MSWNGIEDAHSDNDPREQQGQGRPKRKISPRHSRNRNLAGSESEYPEVSRYISTTHNAALFGMGRRSTVPHPVAFQSP